MAVKLNSNYRTALRFFILLIDEKETRNQFEDDPKVLFVDNKTKDEALWFHQKMTDYQASSPHYKDGKALAIVDRLVLINLLCNNGNTVIIPNYYFSSILHFYDNIILL